MIKILIFVLLFLTSLSSRAEIILNLKSQKLSKENEIKVQSFVNNIYFQILPQRMRDVLNGIKVSINFGPLGELVKPPQPGVINSASTHDYYGKAATSLFGGPSILINEKFISVILQGPTKKIDFYWGHKNFYRQATATLIHELSHLYDLANVKIAVDQEMYNWCKAKAGVKKSHNNHNTGSPTLTSGDPCYLWTKADTAVSTIPYFLNASLFTESYNLYGEKSSAVKLEAPESGENLYLKRSMDNYEFKNSKESFAINMEYYLMDGEFACRRPTITNFLDYHFGRTSRKASCQLNPEQKEALANVDLVNRIDSINVREISYLFASEGESMMSRWGHALLRVLVCPEKSMSTDDCRKDLSNSVVVGFAGSIDTAMIDYMKGIMGDYPSILTADLLPDVIAKYNETELRDLIAYPLNLNSFEMKLLVGRIKEIYWSYSGSYKFFTNNCADEARKLLMTVPRIFNEISAEEIISPLGLRDLLLRKKIASSPPGNRNQLVENRYLYPSKKASYDQIFFQLKASGFATNDVNFVEFGSHNSPTERLTMYRKFLQSLQSDKEYLPAVIRLTDLEAYYQAKKKSRLGEGLSRNQKDELIEKIGEHLKRTKSDVRKSLSGYGIPLFQDFSKSALNRKQNMSNLQQVRTEELKKIILKYDEKFYREMEAIDFTVNELAQNLIDRMGFSGELF